MSLGDYNSDKNLNITIDGVQVDLGNYGWQVPFAIRTLMADLTAVAPSATPTFAGVNFGNQDLSHYEEGTFTATTADAETGGNTGTSATARFTRIGREVFVEIRLLLINTSGMTPGNDFYIQGLPYTVSVANFGGGTVIAHNLTFTGQIASAPKSGSTSLRIVETASAAVLDYVTVSEVSSGSTNLYISFSYFV